MQNHLVIEFRLTYCEFCFEYYFLSIVMSKSLNDLKDLALVNTITRHYYGNSFLTFVFHRQVFRPICILCVFVYPVWLSMMRSFFRSSYICIPIQTPLQILPLVSDLLSLVGCDCKTV